MKNLKNQNEKNEKNEVKPVSRKNTRKGKPYSVKIDGKTLNVKTACFDIEKKEFPLQEGDSFVKKCKKCPGNTRLACLEFKRINTPAPVVKAKRTVKPYGCVIDCFLIGTGKEEAVLLTMEKGLLEKAAKRFVNDIYFVGRTAMGIGRAIGKNGLIERYLNFALYGVGEEPTGCKSTIGFCKHFCNSIKGATI